MGKVILVNKQHVCWVLDFGRDGKAPSPSPSPACLVTFIHTAIPPLPLPCAHGVDPRTLAFHVHFLTWSWQSPCGAGTVIICLTRKMETLREAKWLLQSHTAKPVETGSKVCLTLISHWSTLGCQEGASAHGPDGLKNKQQQVIAHHFMKLFFPTIQNGVYVVSLSTQFNVATNSNYFWLQSQHMGILTI